MEEQEKPVREWRNVSPDEADRLDREMYAAMTPQERLDLQAKLIRMYYGDHPPRLERVLTIAELPRD